MSDVQFRQTKKKFDRIAEKATREIFLKDQRNDHRKSLDANEKVKKIVSKMKEP